MERMDSSGSASGVAPFMRRASQSALSAGVTRQHESMHKRFQQMVANPKVAGGGGGSQTFEEMRELCIFLKEDRDRLEKELTEVRQSNEELEQQVGRMLDTSAEAQKMVREQAKTFGFSEGTTDTTAADLRQSIRDIEKDIQRYDSQYAKEVLVEPMPPLNQNKAAEYSQLVTRKFKRLEQFVLCLRKRIQRLESMESGLGEVASRFGSVSKLVDANLKLEKENKLLREREVRYALSPLLQRRKLAECSHSFLCSLTKALQNELSAARQLIDSYNFEKNPELKLLVRPPAPHLLGTSLLEILAPDNSTRFDDVDPMQPLEVRNNMRIGKLTAENERLIDQLSSVEHTNMALRQQVERMHSERKVRGSIEEAGAAHMADAPAEIKAKKIRELTKLNQKLLEQIEGLHDQIAERDDQVLSLQEFQEEWSTKLREVQEQNVVLSEKTIRNQAAIQDLRTKLEKRTEGCKALYQISLVLIHVFLERYATSKTHKGAAEERLQLMYRDVVRTYLETSSAATKIQSAARGMISRRKLKASGVKTLPPRPVPPPQSIFQEVNRALSGSGAGPSSSSSTPAGEEDQDEGKGKTKGSVYGLFHLLFQALGSVEETTNEFLDVRKMLSILKEEVLEEAKEETARIIAEYQEEFTGMFSQLQDVLVEHLGLEKRTRSVQTEPPQVHHVSCEADLPPPEEELAEEEAVPQAASSSSSSSKAGQRKK